jgi:hypothetical protein
MIPWAGRDVMTEKVVKDKVLCYVVRDGRLLVLRHTDYSFEEMSIQVPVGSVRAGERPRPRRAARSPRGDGADGLRVSEQARRSSRSRISPRPTVASSTGLPGTIPEIKRTIQEQGTTMSNSTQLTQQWWARLGSADRQRVWNRRHSYLPGDLVESMANAGIPVVSDGRWSCVSVGPTGFTVPAAVEHLLERLSRVADSGNPT